MSEDIENEVEREMRRAARIAAVEAAGRVIGERIRRAHPGLRTLAWSANTDNTGRWCVSGQVLGGRHAVESDVRAVLESYAAALGGSEVKDVGDESTMELETTATFAGVEVTVWAMIRRA